LPPEVTLKVRPINLPRENAIALRDLCSRPIVSFNALSFEALTGFLAIEALAVARGRSQTAAFVLNVRLLGAPSDREKRILLRLLNSRERLLRYLLMLLADADLDPRQLLAESATTGNDGRADLRDTSFGLPLLEPLMRTLARDPRRLRHVARLIDDLRSAEEGRRIVPAEFMAVWQPIWAASKESVDGKT